MNPNISAVVDQVIRNRRTVKVFADKPMGATTTRRIVEELIECAAWAPFHRPSDASHQRREELPSIMPWRCYMLDAATCRQVRKLLLDSGDTTKIPRILAAATTLIQVTWLPNPAKDRSDGLFEPTLANMEHIAAASAAIQNLLLAATARGIPSYWSSGGALREQRLFSQLGIPERELLLGSVFLFPPDLENTEHAAGKLREMRGAKEGWARWVDIEAI